MHPLRGGLRFAENISPSAPACRPETVCHPLPPEVDNAISKYESARGMAKTCVYNTVRGEEGGWRERRGGKSFRGVFSYFYPPPLASFFSRSRCKFLRLRFLLLLFFFFSEMIVTEKRDLGGNLCSRFVIIVIDRVWLLYRLV